MGMICIELISFSVSALGCMVNVYLVCVAKIMCMATICAAETVCAGGTDFASSVDAAQERLHSQAGPLGGFGSPTGFTTAPSGFAHPPADMPTRQTFQCRCQTSCVALVISGFSLPPALVTTG